MSGALVLFAHGARDPEWSTPFRTLQRKVAARCPHLAVELAFLELTPPPLDGVLERLAAGHDRLTIAPLFMAQGGHLKQDLPGLLDALRQRHPAVRFELPPPVGEVDTLLDTSGDWLVASAGRS